MPFSGSVYQLPWIFGSNQATTVAQQPGIINPYANNFVLQLGDDLTDIASALSTLNGIIGGIGGSTGAGRMPSDVSFTNNTTLTNLTGMSVNVTASRTYRFDVFIFIKSGAKAGGAQVAISGTATATNIIYDGYGLDTGGTPIHGFAVATALGTAIANINTSVDATAIHMHGTITVNAGGTLTVQGAQDSSSATATVFGQGSRINIADIT